MRIRLNKFFFSFALTLTVGLPTGTQAQVQKQPSREVIDFNNKFIWAVNTSVAGFLSSNTELRKALGPMNRASTGLPDTTGPDFAGSVAQDGRFQKLKTIFGNDRFFCLALAEVDKKTEAPARMAKVGIACFARADRSLAYNGKLVHLDIESWQRGSFMQVDDDGVTTTAYMKTNQPGYPTGYIVNTDRSGSVRSTPHNARGAQ